MEHKQRISVAMATYNGEKYIEEQLLSICRQTRKPDEIVISDDGSKDATLEVVAKVARSEDAQGIDFVVITDNPRHGYCGNFEWAIKHTTGDLIFLTDQDDVWVPEKIERVYSVFLRHPKTVCVIHGASLIDQNGSFIDADFHRIFKLDQLPSNSDSEVRLTQQEWLECATSAALANGMVMCIAKELLQIALPFPMSTGLHDCWIGFCALCMDQCWYLNEKLALYRLHGANTCGSSAKKASFVKRIKRIIRKVSKCDSAILERFQLGKSMVQQLERVGLTDHVAYGTARRIFEIGAAQVDAFQSPGIVGVFKLCKLYFADVRYRRSGTADFLYQLVATLLPRKN